tara:strand:+ start:307 stop:741 length:435 start_codon:yes stop_codon:yes gene_type:complete
MARPKKNTVDYFSHDCFQSKSLHIINRMYGNDGYAFYFKLREILGRTDNHAYDCTKFGAWEYLLTETELTEDNAKKIMQTLFDLGELDEELYNDFGILWWQSFVDLLEDVYSRRKNNIPNKINIFVEENGRTNDDMIMEYDSGI